jgi:biuret amidohydrolase
MQHAHGLEIPETLEEVCDPRRMALLVYDMQVGIVRHVRDAEAFTANVVRVSEVRPLFLRDAPDFQLVPELTPLPSEAVFDKLAMSMFVGTPLEMVLRDCGINAFAIVGAVTEIGIEPTVRHGADLGLIPVVVADACGSVDPAAGERALASLDYALMSLRTDVDTFVGLLSS